MQSEFFLLSFQLSGGKLFYENCILWIPTWKVFKKSFHSEVEKSSDYGLENVTELWFIVIFPISGLTFMYFFLLCGLYLLLIYYSLLVFHYRLWFFVWSFRRIINLHVNFVKKNYKRKFEILSYNGSYFPISLPSVISTEILFFFFIFIHEIFILDFYQAPYFYFTKKSLILTRNTIWCQFLKNFVFEIVSKANRQS